MAAFVRWYEEPVLLTSYGEEYQRYRQAVPAWLPRLRPWRPDARSRQATELITVAKLSMGIDETRSAGSKPRIRLRK